MLLFSQKYWGKLQRKEWLTKGDRNTSFFQRRANFARKKKLTIKLQDECGVWINEQEAIADKFIEDFSKRFKSSHTPQRIILDLGLAPLLSDQENKELIRLPNLEEVRIAVFSIEPNKTPGPDGFGAGFFQNY